MTEQTIRQAIAEELAEKLLTTEELAEKLRVPRSWVFSRTRQNALPMVRVGKYCRFRLSAVLAFLEKE